MCPPSIQHLLVKSTICCECWRHTQSETSNVERLNQTKTSSYLFQIKNSYMPESVHFWAKKKPRESHFRLKRRELQLRYRWLDSYFMKRSSTHVNCFIYKRTSRDFRHRETYMHNDQPVCSTLLSRVDYTLRAPRARAKINSFVGSKRSTKTHWRQRFVSKATKV